MSTSTTSAKAIAIFKFNIINLLGLMIPIIRYGCVSSWVMSKLGTKLGTEPGRRMGDQSKEKNLGGGGTGIKKKKLQPNFFFLFLFFWNWWRPWP